MKKQLICIVCPKGCRLTIDENLTVTGNACERGELYGKKEMTNPTRVVTSTVRITGADVNRLPVKTSRDIPKSQIFDCMKLLENVTVKSPVKTGDIILKNILGLGADIIATSDL